MRIHHEPYPDRPGDTAGEHGAGVGEATKEGDKSDY